MSNIVRI